MLSLLSLVCALAVVFAATADSSCTLYDKDGNPFSFPSMPSVSNACVVNSAGEAFNLALMSSATGEFISSCSTNTIGACSSAATKTLTIFDKVILECGDCLLDGSCRGPW